MKATTRTYFDGHDYEVGEEIPDLGSLVCVDASNGIRKYEGNLKDYNKLPKYDDLATGSSALLYNAEGAKVFKYEASSKEWYELK